MELDPHFNLWRSIGKRASRKRVTRRKSGGRVYFFNTNKSRILNESTRFIRVDTYSYYRVSLDAMRIGDFLRGAMNRSYVWIRLFKTTT